MYFARRPNSCKCKKRYCTKVKRISQKSFCLSLTQLYAHIFVQSGFFREEFSHATINATLTQIPTSVSLLRLSDLNQLGNIELVVPKNLPKMLNNNHNHGNNKVTSTVPKANEIYRPEAHLNKRIGQSQIE